MLLTSTATELGIKKPLVQLTMPLLLTQQKALDKPLSVTLLYLQYENNHTDLPHRVVLRTTTRERERKMSALLIEQQQQPKSSTSLDEP